MCKKNKNHKEVIAKIAKEIYEDGLKETVKETSKTVALLPRVIRAALAPVEKWVMNKEYSIKMTQKMLEAKLENYDPNLIEEPEAYVAVPAINALSYTYASEELLDMYANLLASSMISDTKWKVHPSFVEIIKQLSPDEAKLLKSIADYDGENEFPLINIKMESIQEDSNELYIMLSNFTDIGDNVCDCPSNISSYIDNLIRLSIIEIKSSSRVTGYDYKHLERHSFVREFIGSNSLKKDFKWSFDHYLFMITSFGKAFISICVTNPSINKQK